MECCLAEGELIRVDGEKYGVILRCSKGTIWLTCGDGRDYLISAGNSFEIASHQVAVAEALQAAECTIGKSLSSHSPLERPVIRLAAC
jgi:hypothetical protein